MNDPVRITITLGLLAIIQPQVASAQRLVGRAVLQARTFASGPTAGTRLAALPINGQQPPFVGKQPVQGFSAVLSNGDGSFLAMADNGFGSLENSADFRLRVYRIRPDFRTADGGSGSISVLDFIELRDSQQRVPFIITNHFTTDRVLTGADFDIESMQRAADGTLWFGDEFGPFLLHTDAAGVVLEPPIPLPDLVHPGKQIRSPQNPFYEEASTVRLLNAVRAQAEANGSELPLVLSPLDLLLTVSNPATGLPWPYRSTIMDYPARAQASGGFEGMALSADGTKLYPMLEKSLSHGDPGERIIYEFDIASRAYTGKKFRYHMDPRGTSIGDFILTSEGRGLVIERDDSEGDVNGFKAIYQVDLNKDGAVTKRLVADLLALDDEGGVSRSQQAGDVGLGARFALPFTNIEGLVLLNNKEIAVLNDNNYPFSVGRHRGTGEPDDTEFVIIELDPPLEAKP